MAFFDRAELIEITATKIGVLAPGQTLAAEDNVKIDQALTQLFDQLGEDGILTIADEDEIPASWCPYLAMLAGNLLANDYGSQPFSPEAKQQIEAILRRLTRQTETYEIQQPDYY